MNTGIKPNYSVAIVRVDLTETDERIFEYLKVLSKSLPVSKTCHFMKL